jgi:hypothetical protein
MALRCPFEGKGWQLVWVDPNLNKVGFFYAHCFPVIPELQRRGVYRKEYAGTTLRDHRGLARPEVGAWRH